MVGVGVIPVIWLALLSAPYLSQGLLFHLEELIQALNHPFHIDLVENSFRTVLLFFVGLWYRDPDLSFKSKEL